MFKKFILSASFLLATHTAFSQGVAINEDNSSADASAILDVKSTTKGLLMPRLTQAERNAIATPATGLMIYQIDATAGFYYYNGTAWTAVVTPFLPSWGLTGNAATAGDFIGTTNNVPLEFKVANQRAGYISSLTLGNSNTSFGFQALNPATTGVQNVANGVSALQNNTTGNQNVANGAFALQNNTTGGQNVATGVTALLTNTTGGGNVATGVGALQGNTTGGGNVATGTSALRSNTIGNNNTAIGGSAGRNITTGSNNTAIGNFAGNLITTGSNNITIGNGAQVASPTADNQIRIGNNAITTTEVAGQLTYNAQSATTSNTFPNDRGTDGQVLTTDGAGQLSWTTPTGGGAKLDLVATKISATQTPALSNGTNTGDVIVFDNVNTAPTLGSYSSNTYTVGIGQGGLYYIQVQAVSADHPTANITTGHWFKIEIDPAGPTPSSLVNNRDVYGLFPYPSALNLPAGLKGRSEIKAVVQLNEGDSFVIKGLAGNSNIASAIKNDGSCKLTVIKLN